MSVSESERAKMRRIARDLAESETDDQGTPEQRAELLALINERRHEVGLAPLDEYQREALRRAGDHVLAPEDVIIHKLIAGRPRDLGERW